MAKYDVAVVMGSKSDMPVMELTGKMLDEFGITHRLFVMSAHRNPVKTAEFARSARRRGIKVFIAGAGMSAHLPGAIAAVTTLPVIGVPLSNSPLSGLDSLHSIVQMPTGVPVATMSIDRAGAKNAAIFAAQILSLSDKNLEKKLTAYKRKLANK
ncbi:MAG: 5-(carboxyamino)imidazole ribonucleotide mutase [bacterium]